MKTLLQLNSSMHGGTAASSELASEYAAAWLASNSNGEVQLRDLAQQPVPHLDAERFDAFTTDADQRTPAQHAIAEFSAQLIAELQRANTLVIALPMYNFGLPSMLKAYFDHVARAGITFRYTENGPVGLLTDKRAVVIATRGGRYAGTPADTQSAYLRDFLAFLGITDVDFIYAEGLAMGDESRTASLQAAREEIRSQHTTALAA